jgi:hypothetical protein
MFISSPANALALKLAETIRLSGYVEYQGRHITRQEQDNSIQNSAILRLNAATFLWRPWLALLDGGIGLSYSSRRNGFDQTGQDITGNVNLSLFPRSRFPFTAFFENRQSQLDGDLTSPDLTRTNFGFEQAYATTGGSQYHARYQRTLSTDERDQGSRRRTTDDVEDALSLAFSTSLDSHTFNLSTNYDKVDREIPEEQNTRLTQILRHQYRPDSSLSVDNLQSYNDSDFSRPNSNTSFRLLQFNSNAFWRPDTKKPLLVTGTALLQTQEDEAGDGGQQTKSAVISGQGNYQWSSYLNLRAQASISALESEQDDKLFTLQRAGADYSPAEKALLGMQYAYTLSADISNRTGEEEGTSQQMSLNIGHVFSRSFPVFQGLFNFSASQRGTTLLETKERADIDRTFTHTITSGWTSATANTSTFIRLSASDTRRFGDDEFGLQLINFQASQNHQLTRESFWTGNITFQLNRPLDDSEDDLLDLNTSIDISYTNQRFFGVPRLRFVSELRYLSNSLLNVVRSESMDDIEDDDSFWQNRLEYYLGRTQLRLLGDLGVSNGDLSTLVFFQIRRNFGN